MVCNESEVYQVLNDAFKLAVKVPGVMVLDEAMWEWKADHPAVVSIPRKPKSRGVKAFIVSFAFTHTDYPYCWHFIPDIARPGLNAATTLDMIHRIIQPYAPVSITTDSWFGRPQRLHDSLHFPWTTAINTDQEPALVRIGGAGFSMSITLFSVSHIV